MNKREYALAGQKTTFHFSFLTTVFTALVLLSCGDRPKDATWQVYALEYGYSRGISRSMMVHDAKKEQRSDFSWMVWLIRNRERTILVDTGFKSEKTAEAWMLERFLHVPLLLRKLDIEPDQVTDVVLTHAHWDHVGYVTPYTKATYWIQQKEIDWAKSRVDEGHRSRGGIRLADLKELDKINREGRMRYLKGDAEIAPDIKVHLGGQHTAGIQWLTIKPRKDGQDTIVLASDNAYIYENIERSAATGGCISREANLAEIKSMLTTASDPKLIIPGHDPLVMKRFPLISPGIVEIKAVP